MNQIIVDTWKDAALGHFGVLVLGFEPKQLGVEMAFRVLICQ